MKSSIFVLPLLLGLAFSMNQNVNYSSDINNKSNEKKFNIPIDSSEEAAVDPNGITNIANMFNERGYYKSNGFSFDDQEIVNDFNGNLMYQIPLYNSLLAGDLNFDLSLNYNGSVGHQFFIGHLGTYVQNSRRYNLNAPTWMVSLNGIAIQVA